jgi:hypothetical protein
LTTELATGDAADVLDVAARHRLAVGDDRQRLEDGARILRRALGVEAGEVRRHLGAALIAPAARHGDQLDRAVLAFGGELVEQRAQGVVADLAREQRAHLAQRHGLARAHERGLEDALGIQSLHSS